MYLIFIDADEKDIIAHGLTKEQFWETIKVNLEENKFIQLEEDHRYFANWEQTATLGHCWAFQSAFANDLPEWVESMKEYTVYEVYVVEEPPMPKEDILRIAYLKSRKEFSDDDVVIKRNASYLDNMLSEIEENEEEQRKKNKKNKNHSKKNNDLTVLK